MRARLIAGLSGEDLTPGERAFLRDARPCGIILFSRNCQSQAQIGRLSASARDACGADDLLVLIDQEGGRVQRLRPPLGRLLPPAAAYGALYATQPEEARRMARGVANLLAQDLAALGIDTICAPVLDVPVPGSHGVIGDRAYGAAPEQVASLGRAVAEGLMAGGALPVIKHIPGHGRAMADSHFDLPVVTASKAELTANDFAPFKALAQMPAAMTAHVVFTAVDPDAPASTSSRVTHEIIRGEIGFDGLLLSDDLSMRALKGSMRERAEAVIRAGSDVALHCNGDLAEMRDAAEGAPPLEGLPLRRFEAARAAMARSGVCDATQAEADLALLLAIGAKHAESV